MFDTTLQNALQPASKRRYGELGNAELVKKYGFALRQNPFTTVSLDKRRLLAAAAAAMGARRWRQRSAMLEEQTELLDEEEEPFEVGRCGVAAVAVTS